MMSISFGNALGFRVYGVLGFRVQGSVFFLRALFVAVRVEAHVGQAVLAKLTHCWHHPQSLESRPSLHPHGPALQT